MSKPSFAVTRRVNPPGASPKLTHEQLWKGLGIKARQPKDFISIITSCKIISDEGNKVVRSVSFNDRPEVKEAIELHEPTIAYFEIETGIRITNIISYDEQGDLLLTFSFANGLPGYPEGTVVPASDELNKRLGGGVESTINRMRELAQEGVI